MTNVGKVLIVENDLPTLRALEQVLARDGRWDIKTAPNASDALSLARSYLPDVILSDYDMPGMDGFELCQEVKADPDLGVSLFVILTAFSDTPRKVKGLRLGVDDYLTKPVDAPELLAKVHAMLRIKRLHDELRQDKERLQELQQRLSSSFDKLLTVLRYVLDVRVPGAVGRGNRLAAWAAKVAARFSIPDHLLEDLQRAAMLQELGRVVEPPRTDGEGSTSWLTGFGMDWSYIAASRAILEQVDYLDGAAEVVGAIYENWDGTGLPNRWLKGQIPLRSRILRTLIDFFAAYSEAKGTTATDRVQRALENLSAHNGTRYDPVVVRHVGVVALSEPEMQIEATDVRVPIGELKEGMVLAADLFTTSGTKLLSGGATITERTLEIVRTRHQSDPIIEGATIEL